MREIKFRGKRTDNGEWNRKGDAECEELPTNLKSYFMSADCPLKEENK